MDFFSSLLEEDRPRFPIQEMALLSLNIEKAYGNGKNRIVEIRQAGVEAQASVTMIVRKIRIKEETL